MLRAHAPVRLAQPIPIALHRCHPSLRWQVIAALVGGTLLLGGWNAAQAQFHITKIEEEWELVIAEPDANLTAPQITCVISPYNHTECFHAALELNCRTLPEFAAGGLQLQAWQCEEPLAYVSHGNTGVLNTPNETIRWTQRMYVQEGKLWFEVDHFTSTTWGNFANQGQLKVSVPFGGTNLHGYRSSHSVERSGIGYASNRVGSLKLKAVRYYTPLGLAFVDNSVRTVWPTESAIPVDE